MMRGCDGVVICSGYGRLGKVLEAYHAEIVACLQALQRATELGVQNVVLETDAMAVVEAVNSQAPDRSSASGLLWELKESLFCNFNSSSIVYKPRSCKSRCTQASCLWGKVVSGY